MLPKNRSPGLPWKLKGYKTKREILEDPEAVATWHRTWDLIGQKRGVQRLPDTALFLRAKIAKRGKEKIRAVWGFPIDVIIEEGRFFYPYLEWMKSVEHNIPIAYQIEMANGATEYVNNIHKNKTFVITDWSKFDKSIPAWLIKDPFNILLSSFDMQHVRDSEGLIWPVSAEQSAARMKRVVNYFIATPIRLHDGRRFRKSGGVPSGSLFTNFIDSIVNMIVSRYCYYQTMGCFPTAEVYLADDSFTVSENGFDMDSFAIAAQETFGMTLNLDKSYVTTWKGNVHFPGYFNRDGKPFKPQDLAIASFVYPERNVEDDMTLRVARAVGQMWSTLDGAQAATWWNMIREMMQIEDTSVKEVEDKIISSASQFKYLAMLGVKIENMTMPPMRNGFVWAVEASATCVCDVKSIKMQ